MSKVKALWWSIFSSTVSGFGIVYMISESRTGTEGAPPIIGMWLTGVFFALAAIHVTVGIK